MWRKERRCNVPRGTRNIGPAPFQCANISACTGGMSVSPHTLAWRIEIRQARRRARIFTNDSQDCGRSETCLHYNPLHFIFSEVRFMRRLTLTLLIILAIGVVTIQLSAWGSEGHTWINEVAALKQPKSMPAFFTKASARLGW